MKLLYNSRVMRFLTTIVGMLLCCVLFPSDVFAAPTFSVSPFVIDGKGKPRDIMKYVLTLENSGEGMVSIYPWVTNYTSASGTLAMPDLSNADLSTSLANWIEVTRGVVDLFPGEKHEIPVLIQINMNAKPGLYHAEIRFSRGPNRIEAEANMAGTVIVPVNIEVLDDANERLQLGTFAPKKNWFTGASAEFDVRVENIGNRELVPRGKIRIYDRRGAEVAAIDANQGDDRLVPSANALLGAVWYADGHFGKYKAMLDLEYGERGRGVLQDTVFFWVIPWQKVLGMFLSIALFAVIVAILIHSRTRATPQYAYERAMREEQMIEAELTQEANRDVIFGPTHEDRPTLIQKLKQKISHNPISLEYIQDEVSTPLKQSRIFDSTQVPSAPLEHEGTISLVRIPQRPKQGPNPDHIVNLRR